MERNENGMPIAKNGKPIEDMTRTERRAPMNTDGCSGENGGCGGVGALGALPLAYVYAPSQKFRMMYSPEDALKHGTLFEELYLPMEVYGRE